MKQTALSWFAEKALDVITMNEFNVLLEQAKQMEKEQIEKAHIDGGKNKRTAVKYYNETYKNTEE